MVKEIFGENAKAVAALFRFEPSGFRIRRPNRRARCRSDPECVRSQPVMDVTDRADVFFRSVQTDLVAVYNQVIIASPCDLTKKFLMSFEKKRLPKGIKFTAVRRAVKRVRDNSRKGHPAFLKPDHLIGAGRDLFLQWVTYISAVGAAADCIEQYG